MKILVADDDRDLLELVQFSLVQAGYEVITTQSGRAALESFARDSPDLVILDINMPDVSGYQVCRAIRQRSSTPVMMLTVRNMEDDLVKAYENGADEYVTKPFSPKTLIARVRALERRIPSASVDSLVVGDTRLDTISREVQIGEMRPISLTLLELKMVHALLLSAGRPLSSEKLLQQVWGRSGQSEQRALKQLIYRLRRKLRDANGAEELLQTTPGAGYRLLVSLAKNGAPVEAKI